MTHLINVGRFIFFTHIATILFTLYVSRLFNIISQHLPSVHSYADDTQIYLSFRPCSIHSEINAGLLLIV